MVTIRCRAARTLLCACVGTVARVRVSLLGSMEVTGDDGSPLRVQGVKLRTLVAMLSLECGRVVPTDRLIEDLWHDGPPSDVANALQGLISKLRRSLGSAGLVTMRPSGYVLAIDEACIDVHEFGRRAGTARGALDAAIWRRR